MKTKFIYGLLMMLGFALISFSCSTDDTSKPDDNSAKINQIKNIIQTDTWQITSFIDSGADETDHFTGYSFTFNSNGTLAASNGSASINGTWSITDSNSNDDSYSSDDIDFNIFFSSPANFNDDLSEDWEIVMRTDTKVELMHISGGNGGTDHLTFEKI